MLEGAGQLCRHTFGNFVVQHVLEHGILDHGKSYAKDARNLLVGLVDTMVGWLVGLLV